MMDSDDCALPQLERHLSFLFTLGRIEFRRGAYEIIRSSALALSDPDLRIAMSDYYEYSHRTSDLPAADLVGPPVRDRQLRQRSMAAHLKQAHRDA
jgi:hypothetical protein